MFYLTPYPLPSLLPQILFFNCVLEVSAHSFDGQSQYMCVCV